MGKRFAAEEMDSIQQWKADSWTPTDIHTQLVKDRQRLRQKGPDLTTVRRFLKAKTHKRSVTETRGRKRILSAANLKTMDRVRDELVAKSECQREISWDEVAHKSQMLDNT